MLAPKSPCKALKRRLRTRLADARARAHVDFAARGHDDPHVVDEAEQARVVRRVDGQRLGIRVHDLPSRKSAHGGGRNLHQHARAGFRGTSCAPARESPAELRRRATVRRRQGSQRAPRWAGRPFARRAPQMTAFAMLDARRLTLREFGRSRAGRRAVASIAGGGPVHGQVALQSHGRVGRPRERDIVHQDRRASDDNRHRADEDRDSAERPKRAVHVDAQHDEHESAEHDHGGKALGPRDEETLQVAPVAYPSALLS